MRPQPSRPQTRSSEKFEETGIAARKRRIRSWLILGAGAVGVASAVAKWAMQSRQAAAVPTRNSALRDSLSDASLSQMEGTGTPVPLQGMPDSATPTNDARTFLVELATVSGVPEAEPTVETPVTASPPKKTKTNKSAQSVLDTSVSGAEAGASTSRKRGKMSAEYDQALQANALPTNGREGEHTSREMEMGSMTVNNSTGASAAPPAPAASAGSPAEQALSTQAEGKMAVGEELRDREFPVPPQETVAAPQKLVVDQETMTDNGPREGGAIGAVSGDHQNKGVVGDIMDQGADTPDFAQQR